MREIVRLVHEAHANRGGAFIHASFGDLKGQAFFAVSLYPERTVQINGKEIPSTLIEAFNRQNRDLLQDPRIILGTWYNADEDISYLDVSVVCIRRQEAVSLAEAYNQIAVYALADEIEVTVVTEWSKQGYSTYVSGFSIAPASDSTPTIAAEPS